MEVRAILRLINRACKFTCTGPGLNNCLGFAFVGELKRIHQQHDVPWPCDFPADGNGFRRYIWDRIRKEPDRWAAKARTYAEVRCTQLLKPGEVMDDVDATQVAKKKKSTPVRILSDAELINRLWVCTADTTEYMGDFEVLVATELLEAYDVHVVIAKTPERGNTLLRWNRAWTSPKGIVRGLWEGVSPADIKCTTVVICNSTFMVHWEGCPTVNPVDGYTLGEKQYLPNTADECQVRLFAYLPNARDMHALGYAEATDFSEDTRQTLRYFDDLQNTMMANSYKKTPPCDTDQDSTIGDENDAELKEAMRQSLVAEAARRAKSEQLDRDAETQITNSRRQHEMEAASWLMTKTAIDNQVLRASAATRQVHDVESWWDNNCFWHAVHHAIGECDQYQQLLAFHHNATYIQNRTVSSLRDAVLDHMMVHPQRFEQIWASLQDWRQHYKHKTGARDCTWQEYCNTLR